jgi:hypothetical protein
MAAGLGVDLNEVAHDQCGPTKKAKITIGRARMGS